jgi:DNA-binding transcriptional ArsR family regulator
MTNARSLIEVLGEPMRVTILELLLDTPATATELAQHLPVTRSAVSQHLQMMKSVGLVNDMPAGTRRVYTVDPDALALLRSYFDAFWNRSLEGFRRTAEMTARPPADRSGTGQDLDKPQSDSKEERSDNEDQSHLGQHRS